MAVKRIGVLSDTHLSRPDDRFRDQIRTCFSGIDMVLHAGDLTSPDILDVFGDLEVVAVQGNMCDPRSRNSFPISQTIDIMGYSVVLTHGHAFGYNDLEDALLSHFGDADCIVYGHTHRPVCHRIGNILFLNPGSFSNSGRHGAPPTYGIIEIGATIHGEIRTVVP